MDLLVQQKTRQGTLITYLALMALVLIPVSRMAAPYLMAVLMGSILAVLCNPLYKSLRARRFPPRVASAIVTAGFLLLVLVPLTLFTISAVRQSNALIASLADQGVLTLDSVMSRVLHSWPLDRLLTDTQDVQQRITASLTGWIQTLSGWVLALITQIPELLLQLALGLFAAFFLLVDGKRLFAWAADKVPLSRPIRLMLSASFHDSAVSVVTASAAAAGTQSLIILLAFLGLGIPGALLAAGATFIFAWIPVVGSLPVLVAGGAYLYFDGSYIKLGLLVAAGLLTSVIDNVVRALVLRGRNEMHPLVSLVAMFGGIAMWGIVGVLVGPILAALAIAVLETWPSVARGYGITMGDELEAADALEAARLSAASDLAAPGPAEIPPGGPTTGRKAEGSREART